MPISYELVTFRLSTGGYKPSRALYRRALLQIRIQASVELRLDHNVDTFQVVAVEELSRQPEQTCYRRPWCYRPSASGTAALDAMRQWTERALTLGGIPAEAVTLVSIVFPPPFAVRPGVISDHNA